MSVQINESHFPIIEIEDIRNRKNIIDFRKLIRLTKEEPRFSGDSDKVLITIGLDGSGEILVWCSIVAGEDEKVFSKLKQLWYLTRDPERQSL